ncbi:MAG: hypothetical protein ACYDA3_14375 [Gaiellaceae bacterium]
MSTTFERATLPAPRLDSRFAGYRLVALSAVLSLAIGAVAARGQALTLVVLGLAAFAFTIGLTHWRWSVWGLLLYLPISGIPVILLYPHTGPAVLLKDIVFVVPAYAGFFAFIIARREHATFKAAPVVLLGLFGLVVTLQALNPGLPSLLVGLIGMKVWLLYVPLYFIGYQLIADRAGLRQLLKVMSLAAIVPATIGIAEAVLIYGGSPGVVYSLYGNAAAAATQDFAHMEYAGGGISRRIPSTFSFVTQYYTFLAAMITVTYAWWQGFLVGTRHARFGAGLWALMIAAAFLCGARGAFIFVPLLVVLTLLIERGLARVASVRLLAPVGIFLAAALVFGATGNSIVKATSSTATQEFQNIFVDGFRSAFHITLLGLGTGADTNATRYAFSTPNEFTAVNGTWYESWYVKSALELGIAGLVIVVCLLGTLIVRGLRAHRALHDSRLRSVSAAFLAYLIWNAIYGVKGQYIDLDPTNVYFWFFAGIAAKVATIDRSEVVT